MKIRSITYFCNPKYPPEEKILQKAGKFLAEAKSAYEAAGYEVQTVRLATIPFPKLLGEENIDKLPALTGQLADIARQLNIGYFSLGPALPEMPRSYEVIPDAIFVSKDAFFGGVMADKTDSNAVRIQNSLAAIHACADVIVKSAPIEPNGFANLQFAALANVPAGSPFFPAAYHDKDRPYFGIATKSADLAVTAFGNAQTIEEGRNNLVAEIEKHGKKLAEIAKTLKVRFYGIDFSLAPFPDDAHSLGNAVEKMGIPQNRTARLPRRRRHPDRSRGPRRLPAHRLQRIHATGTRGLCPCKTRRRRDAHHQGYFALFSSLRNGLGYRSAAG